MNIKLFTVQTTLHDGIAVVTLSVNKNVLIFWWCDDADVCPISYTNNREEALYVRCELHHNMRLWKHCTRSSLEISRKQHLGIFLAFHHYSLDPLDTFFCCRVAIWCIVVAEKYSSHLSNHVDIYYFTHIQSMIYILKNLYHGSVVSHKMPISCLRIYHMFSSLQTRLTLSKSFSVTIWCHGNDGGCMSDLLSWQQS